MAAPFVESGLGILDAVAFTLFILCWGVYTWAVDAGPLAHRSIARGMARYRRRWMVSICRRENRIVDAQILGNLVHSVAFFASATVILLGGLLAALGAADQAVLWLEVLPFGSTGTVLALEIKLLSEVLVFVYAFFKFAWAYRLFNYAAIHIGGAPMPSADALSIRNFVNRAARLNGLAGEHFNRGIRAYFYALALLAWFLHPLALIIGTIIVTGVLYRREFHSRAHRLIWNLDGRI